MLIISVGLGASRNPTQILRFVYAMGVATSVNRGMKDAKNKYWNSRYSYQLIIALTSWFKIFPYTGFRLLYGCWSIVSHSKPLSKRVGFFERHTTPTDATPFLAGKNLNLSKQFPGGTRGAAQETLITPIADQTKNHQRKPFGSNQGLVSYYIHTTATIAPRTLPHSLYMLMFSQILMI